MAKGIKALDWATKHESKIAKVIAVAIIVLIVLAVLALSWVVTCGLIKLITLCFGWKFSWGIATGVWLIFILINTCLKRGSSS